MKKLRPTEGEKIQVSPEWTQEERNRLAQLIKSDIDFLLSREEGWRKTIKYEAPCFTESKDRRAALEQMQRFVMAQTADFLDTNRANFEEYLF